MSDKEPEVEVVNDPETELKDTASEVVVDLEKKEPAQQEQPKQETPITRPDELQKLRNRQLWLERQNERIVKQYQELLEKTQTSREQTVPQNVDEIDEIAQKDWKQGVKKLVEKDLESRIQEAFAKKEQAEKEIQRKTSLESELDKSKKRVLDKYPQIEDEGTEESSLYRQVINEDTSILANVHGPEIAMYRMEERMRQMGKTPPSVKPLVDREVSRLARAGASSVIGRQASPNGKITLTKDQKEFCDHYNIPYEQYAKNLKADADRGVES